MRNKGGNGADTRIDQFLATVFIGCDALDTIINEGVNSMLEDSNGFKEGVEDNRFESIQF